jgi:DnaA family protein
MARISTTDLGSPFYPPLVFSVFMNRQLLLDVLATPAASLSNYIDGPNGEALAALRVLAPGRAIYLWGPAGCGRSHLLRALSARPDAVYLDAQSGVEPLCSLAQTEASHAMPKLLAIDDVHRMHPLQQAGVFALYNRWRESAATDGAFALAVSGNRAPLAMPLREDLRTRLGWDLVFRLDPLSDADKLAALKTQAASRGLQLAPEIFKWMLTHYARDIRKQTALLDALDRYSLATGRAITLPLLRTMLLDPESLPL